jgi:hypothetical protein
VADAACVLPLPRRPQMLSTPSGWSQASLFGVGDAPGPAAALAPPAPARDAEFVAKLQLHWLSESQLGLDILLDRTVAMTTCKLGGPGAPWDVSLVVYDVPDRRGIVYKQVSLFQWVCPDTLSGRPIQLDNVERAKWPVAAHVPRMDLHGRNLKVVHPSIGFKMHLKGPRRKPPDIMLRLLKMWESAEAAISRIGEAVYESDTLDSCGWCENASGANLHACPLCQIPWHSECCRAFVRQRVATGIEGRRPDAHVVPPEFESGLCLACQGLTAGGELAGPASSCSGAPL